MLHWCSNFSRCLRACRSQAQCDNVPSFVEHRLSIGMPPVDVDPSIYALKTAIVRLKSYGKGEETHVCRNKRPHLLVLSPEALQLFTTNDAGAFAGALDEQPAPDEPKAHAGGRAVTLSARAYGGLLKLSSSAASREQPDATAAQQERSPEDDLEDGQVGQRCRTPLGIDGFAAKAALKAAMPPPATVAALSQRNADSSRPSCSGDHNTRDASHLMRT